MIDSVVLNGFDNRRIISIQPSNCTEFEVPFEWTNVHGAILCNYKVYKKNNLLTGQVLKGISNHTILVTDSSFLPVTPQLRQLNRFSIVLVAASQKVDLTFLEVRSSSLITVDTWPDSSGKVLTFDSVQLRKKPIVFVRFNGKRYKIKLAEKDFSEEFSGRRYFYIDDHSIRAQN